MSLTWIVPDWPAPAWIRAGTTTRAGGISRPPFASLNLAAHVGDDPHAVTTNRALLREQLRLPAEPLWLDQVHGTTVVDAGAAGGIPQGDGSFTACPGIVCAVLTADCLPVLFCDRAGTRIAVAHAGWRGLAAGVLVSAAQALQCPGTDLLAWLGPAISQPCFEVGEEVRNAFLVQDAGAAEAFRPSPAGRWLADIYQLARRSLGRARIQAVYGGGYCTYREQERFYSYRRHRVTGRMASLLWIDQGGAARP